ncbi:hypothetical protein PYW08_005692 [Mythimna loreyi]|uniref:Uncharacterized protein n=1 Tax=Mythimna loreyi TaxID=667449 RepID=A0ACC2QME7_9NEOP|nr:hypothetical protein PYW08_005692 [Mythimna loreyi]
MHTRPIIIPVKMLENDSTPATASSETSNSEIYSTPATESSKTSNSEIYSTPTTANSETSKSEIYLTPATASSKISNSEICSTPATASSETSNSEILSTPATASCETSNSEICSTPATASSETSNSEICSTPTTASSETSNSEICSTALKIVLARQAESLPCITRRQDIDPQILKNTLPPPVWSTLQSGKTDYGLTANDIKSGTTLMRIYNIENAEVTNPNFMKKCKNDKSKELNKRQHYSPKKVPSRDQLKGTPKTKDPIPTVIPQIKNQGFTLQQKCARKLRTGSADEKTLTNRRAVSQPIFIQPKPQPQPQTPPHPQTLPYPQVQPPPQPSPSERKKSLERRITTKIWQILNRDMFLLDHEKFNNHMQATNSETKQYIINVIKKCNDKKKKPLNQTKVTPLNRTKVTQTSKENRYRDKKRVMKTAVRRRVWALAKASIKRSKHWSQFLAENHIIVDNIDIDKLDLSFIDFEALEIENKILKRIITWLFT